MTIGLRYPALVGLIDISLAGALALVAPPLAVVLAGVGALVVATVLWRLAAHTPTRGGPARDA